MAVIHIPEGEALRDFPSHLARARAGAEIVIEAAAAPPVVTRASSPLLRRLSGSLRLAKACRSKATLDGGFEADLEATIESHQEPLQSSWD